MKAILGRVGLVLVGALGALLVLGALGFGPGRYTLYRNGFVRLDRWTGAVIYTSDLTRRTGDQLAACQRDAAGWRSTALYWEQRAVRDSTRLDSTRLAHLRARLEGLRATAGVVVNPFRDHVRARASAKAPRTP